MLGRLAGEVDAARAAAVAGAPAEAGLEHLADLHLLRQPAPGRYCLAPLPGECAARLDRLHTGRLVS